MIELAQQHEQSKRKRDALHEQMTREASQPVGRATAVCGIACNNRRQDFLKRVPGLYAGERPARIASETRKHRECLERHDH